ncbi:amidohydrolase family protein [Chloroflexota bacterium]
MKNAVIKTVLPFILVAAILLSACNSPLHPQLLGEYLQDLFIANGIVLDSNDFFEPEEEPYMAYAKMLNLIPDTYRSDMRISEGVAESIEEELLSVKDLLYIDGLYGKIDMHEHYRTDGNIDNFLKAAGCFGITKVLFVPTASGPDNAGYEAIWDSLIIKATKDYPGRIIPYCSVDEADPNAAEIVEKYILQGAKGLKLMGGHPEFYDEPMNSPNMYKVYEVVDKYDIPVLLHGSIINIEGLEEQLDQAYGDFPDVTFVHAHYASTIMSGINLKKCAALMDKHPNLYIDLSMGGGIARYHKYLKQDLDKIRDFVIEYQDRILFGSDIILRRQSNSFDFLYERIRCDIDLHEKEAYTCEYGESDWEHKGFNLSDEILRKLYYDNPKKVLGY